MIQPNTGTLSCQRIGSLQIGQCEGGEIRLSRFGEIVFNLIRIGQMRKTPSDTQIDFENVYDFDIAFKQQFKITPPE